jgi:hypothetical protein
VKQVATKKSPTVTIEAPKLKVAVFRIRGTAPYVQNKFSEKAAEQMKEKQKAGSTSKKGAKREGKDFDADYEGAKHFSQEGWIGIPAPAFRAGLISACRLVGFKMTLAKLSLFVEADGFDESDGTPLVRMLKGEPSQHLMHVRNETGVIDLRPRPMWQVGWEADLRIKFDADQFTVQDVANLLLRVGEQVGVGEGRPDSRKSAGMGWGLFEIINQEEESDA